MRLARLEEARAAVKRVVFGTPFVNAATSSYRARGIERRYRKVVRSFENPTVAGPDRETALVARGGKRLDEFRRRDTHRILFVGTDPLQDHGGLLQGLEALGEVVPFTQPDGSYGQLASERELSFDLAVPNGRRLLELLAEAYEGGRPFDLVVGQMWSGYTDVASLEEAKTRFGVLVVNVAMDDRHVFRVKQLGREIGTEALIPHLDLATTAAPEAVRWYEANGCPAVFLPEASDPCIFRPMPEIEKVRDVCFVGARYGIRRRIVGDLHRAGIHVDAYGKGWPLGRIPTTEVPRLFASSKIVLGVGTIGHSSRLVGLKMRDFDAPMSGSCYVTTYNADLEPLFKVGEEIMLYRSPAECVEVIAELLADDDRRQQVAVRGRARAERQHTWCNRFSELLSILNGASS